MLPSGRPNEAFAYSVEAPLSQSYSYSNVPFDFDQPKLSDCGAASLADWARKANKVRDLRDELASREALPGAAGTVLLLKVILAQDKSNPSSEAEALCETLNSKTKLLVDDPNAKLLMSHVWKMLERLDADSPARQKLIDATLQVARGNQYWPANDWLQFLVANHLTESIRIGDQEKFKAAVDLSISRYDRIRANNADYIASREATMYGEAAKRAFKAGHVQPQPP